MPNNSNISLTKPLTYIIKEPLWNRCDKITLEDLDISIT